MCSSNIKKFAYKVDFKKKDVIVFSFKDFFIFRKKFNGMFNLKGKKSNSFKIYIFLLSSFKKIVKKFNPIQLFFIILKKITPFFTTKFRKNKKKLLAVPSLMYGNKKFVLLISWIVRLIKRKSNVFGFKKEDILKNLVEVYNNKGFLLKQKYNYYNFIFSNRLNIRSRYVNYRLFKDWYNELDEELRKDIWKEEYLKMYAGEDDNFKDDFFDWEMTNWARFKTIQKEEKFKKRIAAKMVNKEGFKLKLKTLFIK